MYQQQQQHWRRRWAARRLPRRFARRCVWRRRGEVRVGVEAAWRSGGGGARAALTCPSIISIHEYHARSKLPLSARRMNFCSRFLSSYTSCHVLKPSTRPRCSARFAVRRRRLRWCCMMSRQPEKGGSKRRLRRLITTRFLRSSCSSSRRVGQRREQALKDKRRRADA